MPAVSNSFLREIPKFTIPSSFDVSLWRAMPWLAALAQGHGRRHGHSIYNSVEGYTGDSPGGPGMAGPLEAGTESELRKGRLPGQPG